jgi:hypothetical protein
MLRFIGELVAGRCYEGRQAGLPALSWSQGSVEAPGRQADLSGLFCQARGRSLRTLRRRP